jgi:hypothetical protein
LSSVTEATRFGKPRTNVGRNLLEPFAAVIRCTADPVKADKRTRSKWSRVMRYAAAYKPDSEALDQFIRPGRNGRNCQGR